MRTLFRARHIGHGIITPRRLAWAASSAAAFLATALMHGAQNECEHRSVCRASDAMGSRQMLQSSASSACSPPLLLVAHLRR